MLGLGNVCDVIVIVGGMLLGWPCVGGGIGVCAGWSHPLSVWMKDVRVGVDVLDQYGLVGTGGIDWIALWWELVDGILLMSSSVL